MFFVPGSLFLVLGLVGSFGPEEICDEGTYFGVSFVSEIVEPLELIGINVFLVQCDIEFALDLGAGTLRIPEEFDEFLVAPAIKTLPPARSLLTLQPSESASSGPLELPFKKPSFLTCHKLLEFDHFPWAMIFRRFNPAQIVLLKSVLNVAGLADVNSLIGRLDGINNVGHALTGRSAMLCMMEPEAR